MLSDEALFEQLLHGDLAAFDALYERYERRLFGFILRQLEDRQEAEDVMHDAFIAVLREGKSGRAVASFRGWIFQVARHLCLNRRRSRHRTARALEAATHVVAETAAHSEDVLDEQQAGRALQLAVARLPRALAELFELRAGGLSYEDMARVLDLPLGTVKSRMHEMVSRLRQEVQQ